MHEIFGQQSVEYNCPGCYRSNSDFNAQVSTFCPVSAETEKCCLVLTPYYTQVSQLPSLHRRVPAERHGPAHRGRHGGLPGEPGPGISGEQLRGRPGETL